MLISIDYVVAKNRVLRLSEKLQADISGVYIAPHFTV